MNCTVGTVNVDSKAKHIPLDYFIDTPSPLTGRLFPSNLENTGEI